MNIGFLEYLTYGAFSPNWNVGYLGTEIIQPLILYWNPDIDIFYSIYNPICPTHNTKDDKASDIVRTILYPLSKIMQLAVTKPYHLSFQFLQLFFALCTCYLAILLI